MRSDCTSTRHGWTSLSHVPIVYAQTHGCRLLHTKYTTLGALVFFTIRSVRLLHCTMYISYVPGLDCQRKRLPHHALDPKTDGSGSSGHATNKRCRQELYDAPTAAPFTLKVLIASLLKADVMETLLYSTGPPTRHT